MIRSIADFQRIWSAEIEATQKVFKHLTDKALHHEFTPELRTLGRLAWHVTTSISEMMSRTGLALGGPRPEDPVPPSAKGILQAYNEAAMSLLTQVTSTWTDATMEVEDEMYGQKWKRGFTLTALIHHQIHHRGQMTVLMRLAGLSVPGVYGPAREEWAQWGVQPPAI